jgi:uncharacterized protein YbjT (DUF2867 family)
MRIAVAGATGRAGRHVVDVLTKFEEWLGKEAA